MVQLGFDIPLYYSSRQEITLDGNTYIANKIIPLNLTTTPKGVVQGSIPISNLDLAIGVVALGEILQGKTCKIYTAYTLDSSVILADTVLLLDGIVNGVSSISEKEVVLTVNGINSNILNSPRIYIAPNLFNHAIPAGTKITWGDSTYELVAGK